MKKNLDRKTGVDALMQILIEHARDGIIDEVISMLEKGPPGRNPPPEKFALHEWFQKLDEQGQEHIQKIIQESVDSTLFSTLVILDGAAGGYPVKEELSDFALYIQTYQDNNAEAGDLPRVRVKLNPWGATEDLHDVFRWTLAERCE